MAVQDDAREEELIKLFRLTRPPGASRGDTDAILLLDGQAIPFELKSTSRKSVTTVRDFSPDHVQKWRGKHWLIGFYDEKGLTLRYSIYGSPQRMSPWIEEKERYVRPDFDLADRVPELLGMGQLNRILGAKKEYSLKDAKSLQKRQYTVDEYRKRMDRESGYSPERMLELLRERCEYIIRRGATLNNPHIPGTFFDGWERITEDHAQRLRVLVRQALAAKA